MHTILSGFSCVLLCGFLCAGCASPPERPVDGAEAYLAPQQRDMELREIRGRKIYLSDEVDPMRDVDDRQRW